MQTEKKVFEQLFSNDRVELESKKVELGIVDNVANVRVLLSNLLSEIKQKGDVALDNLNAVEVLGQKALAAFKDGDRYIEQIDNLYKQLGVPDKATNDPEVKKLLLQMDLLLTYRKRYNF